VTVNKGVGDRGFIVCPECGRTEPVFGPNYPKSIMLKGGLPRQHNHPLEQGRLCDGHAVGNYFLGHKFPTDVLLIQLKLDAPVVCGFVDTPARSGRPGRVALTSLVEAMCLAASRTLQIEEGELAGNWSPVLGGGDSLAYIFLYDLLPGGAGYTRLVKQSLDVVLLATEKLLEACDCETSCYKCLRHYANNFYHASLDRWLALSLLKYIRYGNRPVLSKQEQERSLLPLVELLRLQNLQYELETVRNDTIIPLIIHREDGSQIWVDVHHPMVALACSESSVCSAAAAEMIEFCDLDAFTLRHDLPKAVELLQL
jgi:hypothetical protein